MYQFLFLSVSCASAFVQPNVMFSRPKPIEHAKISSPSESNHLVENPSRSNNGVAMQGIFDGSGGIIDPAIDFMVLGTVFLFGAAVKDGYSAKNYQPIAREPVPPYVPTGITTSIDDTEDVKNID